MLDVASSLSSIGSRLLTGIKKYTEKKQTKDFLSDGFEKEINYYENTYEEALTATEEVLPLFDKIGKEINLHNTNEICSAYAPIPKIIANLVWAFVNFAKACSEISGFQGFMSNLEEYDKISYDFINMMKKGYFPKENKVVIDGSYYRFFQLYKKELLKEAKIKPKNLNNAFQEFQPILDKVKRLLNFMKQTKNKKILTTKETRKKIKRNLKLLNIKVQSLEIKEAANNRLDDFFPKQFISIEYFHERLGL